MGEIKDYSLYLVLSEECGRGRSALEIAKLAVAGGIDILQMREKHKTRSQLLELGGALCALCRNSGVKFIVNDNPILARDLDADGVHLGQEDLKEFGLDEVREILGNDKIIGISTHSIEQFEDADQRDFDYIAFGPIFPTKTRDYCVGTDDVEKIAESAKKPVVFIGGINLGNVGDLISKGAKNIAMIRSITEADDVKKAASEFKTKLRKKANVK